MRKENEFMESQARYWVAEKSSTDKEDGISIPVSSFKIVHSFLKGYVIRTLLKRVGSGLQQINSRHIESVLNLIDSNRPQAMINLPNKIIVERSYDKILFIHGSNPVLSEYSYEISGPGAFYLNEIDRQILIEVMEMEVKPDVGESKDIAYLDADLIKFPLTMRNIRPGDRFIPLGMNGHKKIKNYFIDLKVPSGIRISTPILIMQDTPIWICGFRIDDRFKLTSTTKRVLKASIYRGKHSSHSSSL
jgi:tRNA(Ile)-lysidine synthase